MEADCSGAKAEDEGTCIIAHPARDGRPDGGRLGRRSRQRWRREPCGAPCATIRPPILTGLDGPRVSGPSARTFLDLQEADRRVAERGHVVEQPPGRTGRRRVGPAPGADGCGADERRGSPTRPLGGERRACRPRPGAGARPHRLFPAGPRSRARRTPPLAGGVAPSSADLSEGRPLRRRSAGRCRSTRAWRRASGTRPPTRPGRAEWARPCRP